MKLHSVIEFSPPLQFMLSILRRDSQSAPERVSERERGG